MKTYHHLFNSVLFACISAILFGLTADRIALAEGVSPNRPTTETHPNQPSRIEGELSLAIDTPQGAIDLGEPFDLTLTVANGSSVTQENIQLSLPYVPGLRYSAGPGIPTDPIFEAKISLDDLAPGEAHQLVYTLQNDGVKPGAVAFEATVTSLWQDATTARKNIPFKPAPPENKQVGKDGGQAAFHHNRFKTTFPPGWLDKNADIRFQLNELTPLPDQHSGLLFAFDIEAYDNNKEIVTFDKPITMTVAISDVVDLQNWDESSFYIQTREKKNEEWQTVPFTLDAEAGTLSFQTTHFSSYQGGSEVSAWTLTYNPPGVSAYSGSANYSGQSDENQHREVIPFSTWVR